MSMTINRIFFFEIIKYTFGCGLNLGLKAALTAILTHFDFPLYISYLISQIIILLSSFFYHYKITFARTFDSWKSVLNAFKLYVPSVICFNTLDYVLVVCLAPRIGQVLQSYTNLSIESRQLINTTTILLVSCMIFALRFLVYRVIFKKSKKSIGSSQNTNSSLP